MLLEFRVRNYRSIRDEQALTLIASGDKEWAATHLAPTGLKAAPHALRSAVVYGPNASGKSSLLRALDYLRAVVAESATLIQPGQTYNIQPFKLDAASAQQPTEFEITFLLSGLRHQYAFSMTPQRIVSESLLVYRSSKPTQLFSRQHLEGDGYDYEFSTYLTGPRKLWQESTRPNALFLSMAAQLNSEQLSPVFNWIVHNILFLPAGATVLPDFTTALLATEPGRASIREFLSAADISIADVQAVPRKGMHAQWVLGASGLQASQEEREFMMPVFEHSTPKGSAKFELHDESEGTQRLYGLIAPVLDCLREGRVLVVDELDSSLHTLLVRRLITMFHTPELNPKGAQLIFSTHDTSLLDHTLFRRDQVWFTEKDADQATRLYPLTDFSPRKQEAWERGYLSGRYGAVPFFSDWPRSAKAGVF
ncbi:MAG: ATP-binding protein [Pseudomonas sp.]|uniref:AAA family ATPase n=1 Tax=Pseudomonas sp. TaxID=306 RepID=UPI00054B0057|nr:ATP-binding protein [Pseudomonas sp.]KJS74886.1 MAG: phage resistance protein [Comamonadaceae bacterium BICA1-1]MDO9617583.1 ATP-binding protein [Pseudomonas sp.]